MFDAKYKTAIRELKLNIEKKYGKTEIILFGSAARGVANEESDIDILALVSCELNNSIEESIFEEAFYVELKYNIILGIVVYAKNFWESPKAEVMPLYQNIARDGISL